MPDMHVRVCPECDCEYLPRIEVCSDCGAALVDRVLSEDDEPEDAVENAAAPAGPPPGEYLPIARRDRPLELDALAKRLGKQGLPFKVESRGGGMGFELRVRREEAGAAVALLEDLLRPGDLPSDVDRDAYEACPACEASLPDGARSCPDCGLELAFEAKCPMCGRECDPERERCPDCEREAGSG